MSRGMRRPRWGWVVLLAVGLGLVPSLAASASAGPGTDLPTLGLPGLLPGPLGSSPAGSAPSSTVPPSASGAAPGVPSSSSSSQPTPYLYGLPTGVGPLQSQPASGPSCPASPVTPASTFDANGPAGTDTEAACAQFHQGFQKGDPETVVAYVEGGVNWHLSGLGQSFADHIYVNWKELPIPCVGNSTFGVDPNACVPAWSANPEAYDVTGTGLINIEDWAHDPRVAHSDGNSFLDPEDLIVAFSCFDRFLLGVSGSEPIGTASWPGGVLHCSNTDPHAPDGTAATVSNDGSGFPHDISGWNFYNADNDPATVDSAYDHSDGEMQNVMAYCPTCMIMPVKAGAEALDETDTLAEAWLYAGMAGAKVITSVTADLGYSSFMANAVKWLTAHGVAMVEASNDFDSTDHQGGMYWPGVVPGNGVLVNQDGTGWIRSDITSWGTHNLFDVAGQSTTSSSTAVMGGIFGLLMAYGQDAYTHGLIPAPLTGSEAIQVMRQASAPITNTKLAWPGTPGDWSEQYGYGIPNLDTAMVDISKDDVAPAASITSPSWYQLEDPTKTTTVPVDGTISESEGSGPYSWALQYGLGPQPTTWHDIGSGTSSGSFSGQLGTLDLGAIPTSFSEKPFTMSEDKELSTADQYDVTLRVVVTPQHGVPSGTDRRTIDVVHDPSWLSGFPLKIPSSGESEPALVDLQGTGRLDMVFGTTDGEIEAIDPATGKNVPGWPVHTEAVPCLPCSILGIPPPDDAVISDVAVGDLDHTGQLSVVVSTEDGVVYVFDSHGHVEPGWPKTLDTGVTAPAVPRPALAYTRQPIEGAVAAPVLAPLQAGSPDLDIVQAGWDGYIHVWDASGNDVPGWPVKVQQPTAGPPSSSYDLIDDQKLDATPAVAYLDGPGNPPSIVERSQYTYTQGAGLQLGAEDFVYAYGADGQLRANWPVEVPAVAEYYSSAQEFVTEGTSSVAAADLTGTGLGPDDVVISTPFTPPVIVDASGQIVGAYGGPAPGAGSLTYKGLLTDPESAESHLPDVPVSFATTGGSFGKLAGTLRFAASQSGGASLLAAELEANAGLAINEYESVFPATGGSQSPGFPGTRMGINFLGAPIFTSVDGTGLGDVVDGGDSDALTAYNALGAEAPGFPKWTTGWTVFSPSSGDLFGDGGNELVSTTREGYLFVWTTKGKASGNDQWWRWQHDEYNSGNYETVDAAARGRARPELAAGPAPGPIRGPGRHVVRRHPRLLRGDLHQPFGDPH